MKEDHGRKTVTTTVTVTLTVTVTVTVTLTLTVIVTVAVAVTVTVTVTVSVTVVGEVGAAESSRICVCAHAATHVFVVIQRHLCDCSHAATARQHPHKFDPCSVRFCHN